MSIRTYSCVFAIVAVLAVACSRDAQPLSPSVGGSVFAVAGGLERIVKLFDACDPATFNAILGPGACTRNGGVTFQNFIDELTRTRSAGAWHFAPTVLTMKEGQALVALNTGGETHTFTEVEHFGGGIIPGLNVLSGNPVEAEECKNLTGADFLAPGQSSDLDVADDEGTELYQCCIHPWMRTVVHKRG